MPWSGRLIEEPTAEQIEQRSVLMRLWRSHREGEAFYPARFVNGAASWLLTWGLIEPVGDEGWRITPAGVEEWARMVTPIIGDSDAALRRIAGGVSPVCEEPGCDDLKIIGPNGRLMTKCKVHLKTGEA